jgi:predicted nucleic acid-binding protein
MWYIDSSAVIKLIKAEAESEALVKDLTTPLITSRITRVEIIRTITIHNPEFLEAAYEVLADIPMLPVDDSVFATAENFPQFIKLRTLDALHIASALVIKNAIKGVITYDRGMEEAAKSLGFITLSPGIK